MRPRSTSTIADAPVFAEPLAGLGLTVTWGNSGVADSIGADSLTLSGKEAGYGTIRGFGMSVKETSVCVVDDAGVVLHESKVRSTPAAIAGAVRKYAPEAARVGLEAGGASSWLCRELADAGLPVVHMEARHAHRALSMRINKTDRNDARGLADLMRVGWFKPAHAKSADSHRLRSALLARKRLIDIRRHMENQLRNIIKTSGARLGTRKQQVVRIARVGDGTPSRKGKRS